MIMKISPDPKNLKYNSLILPQKSFSQNGDFTKKQRPKKFKENDLNDIFEGELLRKRAPVDYADDSGIFKNKKLKT